MPAAGVSAGSHSLGTCIAMSASSTMVLSSPCWCEVYFCIPKVEEGTGQGLLSGTLGQKRQPRWVEALPQG